MQLTLKGFLYLQAEEQGEAGEVGVPLGVELLGVEARLGPRVPHARLIPHGLAVGSDLPHSLHGVYEQDCHEYEHDLKSILSLGHHCREKEVQEQ